LFLALVAVCTVEAKSKADFVEAFWMNPSRKIIKSPSQISVPASLRGTYSLSQDSEGQLVTNLKNDQFVVRPGFTQTVGTRSPAEGLTGSILNTTQESIAQQAVGATGGVIPNNLPASQEAQKLQLATINGVAPFTTTVALNQNNATAVNGVVGEDPESATEALKQGVAIGNALGGGGASASYEGYKAPETTAENFSYGVAQSGSTTASCVTCPPQSKFAGGAPLMEPNYSNGNFSVQDAALLRPSSVTQVPISSMETIDSANQLTDVYTLNTLMFANSKGRRTRFQGDPIRGDVAIQPVATRGGWFQTSQSINPVESLQQGALTVMAGSGSPQSTGVISAATMGSLGQGISGSLFTPQAQAFNAQQGADAIVTQGMQAGASEEQRVNLLTTVAGQQAINTQQNLTTVGT
jgi:hypothetical protein